MNELEINHQSIYYPNVNKKGIVASLYTFGYRQFALTTLVENIGIYKKICNDIENKNPIVHSEVSEFALNYLIDSIKITICFENFFKGYLLLQGFVIHKLDKSIFPNLTAEQQKRPILLSEILSEQDWKVDNRLHKINSKLENKIIGISKLTIGMKELTTIGYANSMGVNKEVIDLCKTYSEYRNNLHYYMGEHISIGKKSYSNLIMLIDFVNNNVVKFQNSLIDDLKKGDAYKVGKIVY